MSLAEIESARRVVSSTLAETPVMRSTRIGERIGARTLLKAELFQKTGSFKSRGALNRVNALSPEERETGLITVSGGNHAQGLAFAAGRAGVPCLVVMPEGVASSKAAATRSHGAEVVLHGDVTEAFERMEELRRKRGLLLVHPYADPHVVAGQGTIGLEILDQVPEVTVVVVPVGGGGLISGIATAIKERRGSAVRVVGVEHEGAAGMRAAWDAGHAVSLDLVDSSVLSLAAPAVGALNYELTRRYVDDLVTLTLEEIVHGLNVLMTSAKLYSELAGAASTAALLAGKVPVRSDDTVVAVVSGGNVDWNELSRVMAMAD